MKPRILDPAKPLPVLTEDQERLAEDVAAAAEQALGGRDPSLTAAVCALLLAGVVAGQGIRDADAVEPLVLALLNTVMDEMNALALAELAIVRAMAAAKKSGN